LRLGGRLEFTVKLVYERVNARSEKPALVPRELSERRLDLSQ
jgi:hypothetical protein